MVVRGERENPNADASVWRNDEGEFEYVVWEEVRGGEATGTGLGCSNVGSGGEDGKGVKKGDGVVVAVVAGGTSDSDGVEPGSTFLSDGQLRAELPVDTGRLLLPLLPLSEALSEPFE